MSTSSVVVSCGPVAGAQAEGLRCRFGKDKSVPASWDDERQVLCCTIGTQVRSVHASAPSGCLFHVCCLALKCLVRPPNVARRPPMLMLIMLLTVLWPCVSVSVCVLGRGRCCRTIAPRTFRMRWWTAGGRCCCTATSAGELLCCALLDHQRALAWLLQAILSKPCTACTRTAHLTAPCRQENDNDCCRPVDSRGCCGKKVRNS